MCALSGCGVIWDSGGQRHAIGLGYVAWPIADPQQTTAVQGVDVIGAAVIATQNDAGIVVGYTSERSVILRNDQVVTLDCLKCDLADAHAAAMNIR
jgi:hypothetical protein